MCIVKNKILKVNQFDRKKKLYPCVPFVPSLFSIDENKMLSFKQCLFCSDYFYSKDVSHIYYFMYNTKIWLCNKCNIW